MPISRDEQNDKTLGLGEIFGRNARALRAEAGISRDELARAARLFGARWTDSRVGDIEGGRHTPGLAAMVVHAAVLAHLTERNDLRLTDLFAGDEDVRLNDGLVVTASTVRRILGGGAVALGGDDIPGAPTTNELPARIEQTVASMVTAAADEVPRDSRLPDKIDDAGRSAIAMTVRSSTGLADHRAAKKLGLNIYELTGWALRLWGRPFGLERNHRAGEDATPHRRSHTSRALLRELREAMEK